MITTFQDDCSMYEDTLARQHHSELDGSAANAMGRSPYVYTVSPEAMDNLMDLIKNHIRISGRH